MKKSGFFFMSFALAVIASSCVSVPTEKVVNTTDLGVYNPSNVAEENLCTVVIDQYLLVNKFDNNDKVGWGFPYSERTVKVPAGVHTFRLWYTDKYRVSTGNATVIAQLEKGNTYLLRGLVESQRIKYQVVLYNDRQIGAEVTLDLNKLQGNDPGMLPTYIKYVMNPTMDEVGNSVKLENSNTILVYKPDMVYTMTDKKTGKSTEGRRGFAMDFFMKNGKAYLLETDITKMSSDQFLDSEYTDTAQTVLIPVACDGKTVTYKYEKPVSLKDTEVVFSITEIKQ